MRAICLYHDWRRDSGKPNPASRKLWGGPPGQRAGFPTSGTAL